MTDVEKLPGSGNINNGKSVGEERQGEGGKSTLIHFLVNITYRDGLKGGPQVQ